MGVVDRCTTCHQGIANPALLDASVPQPFRAHPPIPHRVASGAARSAIAAKARRPKWRRRTKRRLHGSSRCCRYVSFRRPAARATARTLPETPQLDRGRQLLAHSIASGAIACRAIDRPEMLGPDLTNIGTKVSRQWIYKWLKEPRTVTDSSGNVTVTATIPRIAAAHAAVPSDRARTARSFRLFEHAAGKPIEPYILTASGCALSKQPDLPTRARCVSARCFARPAIRLPSRAPEKQS